MVNVADVPVVILAGGKGARFDHESQVLPKPMIEVCGKPILEHIVDSFVDQGFRQFIVATGHLHEKIDAWVISQAGSIMETMFYYGPRTWGRRMDGASILAQDTGGESLTGERLLRLRKIIGDRPFVVTYGDGLSDVRMEDVLADHEETGATATITVVHPPGRFGVVEFYSDQIPERFKMVASFEEKPTLGWINGGFMVMEPHAWDYLGGADLSLESGVLPLIARKNELAAHRHLSYWRCMDTRRDRDQIEDDVRRRGGALPWRCKMGV